MVGRLDGAGTGQQHVLGDGGKRALGIVGMQTAVLPVQGRPVIDQPQPPVPEQQVGVACAAVDIRRQGVSHTTAAASSGSGSPMAPAA